MPSRREFLSSALLIPGVSLRGTRPSRVSYEDVLGTSMELTVWTRSATAAADGERAALDEIRRLDTLLSTYRPDSEISRLGRTMLSAGSTERSELLALYDDWHRWSGRAIASDIGGRLNVDALGKAFIVDRVVAHIHRAVPQVEGVLLNIGGDIATTGPAADVTVIDPTRPAENDEPLTRLRVSGRAVATSGSYARAGHLVDPRNGKTASGARAATVIAGDCVTANALATALCVLSAADGLALVERTPAAESLLITATRAELRSTGFSRYERPRLTSTVVAANWPAGYELRIALTLTGQRSQDLFARRGRGFGKSPYVAIWVDDERGRAVRTVAVWGDRWRYLPELADWWAIAKNDRALNTTATRATRPAGEYTVTWNGLDDKGAALPTGQYRINLEVSREHGTYARRTGAIACGNAPATLTFTESAEFAPVAITYGPRPAAS